MKPGKFSPKAVRYIEAPPKRKNILHGSVRSTKTTNNLFLMPERVLKSPPGDVLLTGKTSRTVYRNVIRPMQLMWGTERVRYNLGLEEGSIGGRPFYVAGANNEAAVSKIQGLTVAYWNADEASLYPESFVVMALSRMSPEGACCDLTMNPQGPHHFLMQNHIGPVVGDSLEGEDADTRVMHFTLSDNLNLSEAYKTSLVKEMGGLNTLFGMRYIRGLWVFAEGTVYDFFSESEHVLKELPPQRFDFLDVAGDYGTSNATSLGLYGSWRAPLREGPLKGLRAVRLGGYYYSGRDSGKQRTDAQHATAFEGWLADMLKKVQPDRRTPQAQVRSVILDPSAASFKAELRERGFTVRDAVNDVVDGIRTQAQMLHAGEYRLGPDPSNAPCIKDYGAYLWDANAQARGEDKPLKQNDHTKDEERYYLHTLYRKGASTSAVAAEEVYA